MSNEKGKLISVIVPVYNIEAYVEKCIQSLINQTYRDLEIILVDDGSTDRSGIICDRYAKQDIRIIVLHKENGGLSDARNYALDRLHGDFVAFVDGDDWVHPQMYELMYGVMEVQGADVVTCGFEQQDVAFASKKYKLDELNLKLLTGAEALSDIETPLVVAWNKLYKKELFVNNRYPKGKLHEDEYIIHRIFYLCSKVAIIQQPLYFYTIRNGSIVSQMTPNRIDNALEAFADRVEFADNKEWLEVMPAVVKRYCDYCIDRYQEISVGRYPCIDQKYLDILWKAERSVFNRYSDIQIGDKYRIFANSPKQYDRWTVHMKRRNILHSFLKSIQSRILWCIGKNG